MKWSLDLIRLVIEPKELPKSRIENEQSICELLLIDLELRANGDDRTGNVLSGSCRQIKLSDFDSWQEFMLIENLSGINEFLINATGIEKN